MASTDPLNLTTSDHSKLPIYRLEDQNSSSNAFYTPEAPSASLPDDDERGVVAEEEAARSVAAINSRHKAASLRTDTRTRQLERRSLGKQAQRRATLPSLPVVEDIGDATPTPNPWYEYLYDLDISPIHFPDPDLDSENHQTPAFPEPSQQPSFAMPSPAAQSYVSNEHAEPNIGGFVPLPAPNVHPHEFPDFIDPSSSIVHSSFLDGPKQPAPPSPSPSFPSADNVSHTTPYQDTSQSIRPPTVRPGSNRLDKDSEVRPTQPTTFGSSIPTTPSTSHRQQQRPLTTRPISSQPADYQEGSGQNTRPSDPRPPKVQRPSSAQISRPSRIQPPKTQSPRLSETAPAKPPHPQKPQNTPTPEIQQYSGTRPPQTPPPSKPQPQNAGPPESKVTTRPPSVRFEQPGTTSVSPSKAENIQMQPERPSMHPTKSQMETQYVNMLLALDDIPQIYNMLANFFTWILLAGFILFPGTFTSLQNLGNQGTVDPRLVNAVTHVPLFVIAWICTAIGGAGMTWLTWRWHKNYIWVLNKVFLPGCLNSLAGLLSTITNIFGVQHGQLGTTSKVTVIVTSAATGVCGILTLIYTFWLVRRVKAKHDQEVGKERAGKHGEGVVDLSKRRAV